ncbi:MAG: methyltransferase domain-containing protein, partial [Anaerolineales bacterium]|nr:methyltransferase domain-containing protein [Anaerolineales bacterium]
MNDFNFACPVCRSELTAVSDNALHCNLDNITFRQRDGIWRLLAPGAAHKYARFIREYETVRLQEGRSSENPAYYRTLPFHDLTGRRTEEWHIRARSFLTLLTNVLEPQSSVLSPQSSVLTVLDLGAGNGWLSNRLAEKGHAVTAVDLMVNTFDGLGAHIHYEHNFVAVQAEYDRLPLMDDQFDLVIFNASFHYAVDYATTLTEACRVLRPEGKVVIMDTAVYHNPAAGQQMVREREAQFQKTYGFPSNALPNEN